MDIGEGSRLTMKGGNNFSLEVNFSRGLSGVSSGNGFINGFISCSSLAEAFKLMRPGALGWSFVPETWSTK